VCFSNVADNWVIPTQLSNWNGFDSFGVRREEDAYVNNLFLKMII
jgi:hypothetical protein